MARQSRALRLFQGVVVVAVAVLFGKVTLAATDTNALLPDGKILCEAPAAKSVNCSLQANSVSKNCSVHLLSDDNCFNLWNCAQIYTAINDLNFNQSFDEKRNVTTLILRNYEENIILLRTIGEDEHWWRVNLPEGKHNVTIFDLPGRLNEQTPIMFPNRSSKACETCPPPLMKWISFKNLHLCQVVVSSTSNISNVAINIYGTNQTGLVTKDCERSWNFSLSARISGQKNEILTAEELYSKGYCFVISVNFSSGQLGRYKCLVYEDMTVTQYEAARAPIDVPVWWIIVLVWVVICLVVASLVPLIIHKGLLRVHCKGYGRTVQKHIVERRSEDSLHEDKGRSQLPESLPFLEGAVAPTIRAPPTCR